MKRNRERINMVDDITTIEIPFENVWDLDEEETFIINSIYYDYEDAEYAYDKECYDYYYCPLFLSKENNDSWHVIIAGWDDTALFDHWLDYRDWYYDDFLSDEDYWCKWTKDKKYR